MPCNCISFFAIRATASCGNEYVIIVAYIAAMHFKENRWKHPVFVSKHTIFVGKFLLHSSCCLSSITNEYLLKFQVIQITG